jgi:putative N6-adenine-specific DNA methylase
VGSNPTLSASEAPQAGRNPLWARLAEPVAPASTSLKFFATVTPGLERWLDRELRALGVSGRVLRGGVEARGNIEQLWTASAGSRLAESVRVRLKPFRATSFAELERGLARLPWHAYLRPHAAPQISVTCHKSRLYHSDAVSERVRRVLEACLGSTAAEHGCAAVFVRIDRDIVQTSIDASGERLHRRGYRTHIGEAPLRETVAAALVRLASEALGERSAPAEPVPQLWDPFCGSGTIPIEWVLFRQGELPGAQRGFAFERWPIHDPAIYAEWLARARSGPSMASTAFAFGSDASPKALRAAEHNALAAGLAQQCRFMCADFEQAARQVPAGALIVTNPPYGVRLARSGLSEVYARFERLLSTRTDLRPVVMACGFAPYLEHTRLDWTVAAEIKVGGLPVRLVQLA